MRTIDMLRKRAALLNAGGYAQMGSRHIMEKIVEYLMEGLNLVAAIITIWGFLCSRKGKKKNTKKRSRPKR